MESVKMNLKDREITDIDVEEVAHLYERHTQQTQRAQQLRRERNLIQDTLKTQPGKVAEFKEKAKSVREEIKQVEKELEDLHTQLLTESKKFPNSTHPDVPRDGEGKLVALVGEKPAFTFEPRPHWELGQMWDLFDFEKGAEIASAGYYYTKNDAVLLEMALINWATQKVAAKFNFTPILTPDLVNHSYAEACGFRPRSEASQMYSIEDTNLCLIGTSEIPLGGLQAGKLYYHTDYDQLPVKYVGFSHCFRRETGHGGALSRGLFRVHQFSKVEMFVVCLPEDSDRIHDELLNIEIEIFSELGLHFRVLDMPSNDLGAPAYRKYDTEAWFPSRNDYGEISSASNCTDYQSRRLNLRAKDKEGQTFYLHTLNATALAVPRIMMCILENFQREDGTVSVPHVLVPFMGGKTSIGGRK